MKKVQNASVEIAQNAQFINFFKEFLSIFIKKLERIFIDFSVFDI